MKSSVDCVTTDVTIHNELAQSLEAGKPLQMAISSWSTTMHSVVGVQAAAGQSWEVMLSRAFNRIRDCYWTFDQDQRGRVSTESNWFMNWHGKANKNLVGNIVIDGLTVEVVVVDARLVYGRLDFSVTPKSGLVWLA